jgi:two-component system sensor histidine kinase KdpD
MVVSQLTALIRQRAANEAQTQALAEADRLKSALLSMVSHDFRSPLTSIKTGITTLLQEGLPWDEDAQRELLLGINDETDRLNRMVGNILALSRLEAGAWRPQCEIVSLTEVVATVLQAFSAEENRRIQISLEAAPAEVFLDMVQIAQVLHNLLENALKYSPGASPVHLRAMQEDSVLVVEVMDSGAGVTPDEKNRVFERFYRAPQWRESSLPGTGIGLAVCSGLVEAHGGRLSVSNRAEGGAVFRLTLPLRPSRGAPSEYLGTSDP